jgi:hypothetical protein
MEAVDIERETICDRCGCISDSAPGLECGWDESPNEDGSQLCPGTFRSKAYYETVVATGFFPPGT